MLLLRKKHEPQPAIDPAEPANDEPIACEGPPQQADEPAEAAVASAEAPQAPAVECVAAEAGTPDVTPKEERRLIIAAGIRFRGEIAGCDQLVIDGQVEAEVKACRRIAVSEGGAFKGIAAADEAEIAGSYAGSLTVQEKLFVARTAQVIGSVRYGRLIVEEGAELAGDIRKLNRDASGETLAEAGVPAAAAHADMRREHPDAAPRDEGRESDDVAGMFASAVAARDLSRVEEAEALFKAVVLRQPQHAAALTHLGKLARRRGDRAAALSHFEAAAKADPQNAWARCDAAAMLHELDRRAEAETIYRSILAADPKHVGALSGLGHLAKESGDRNAALAHFEAAVAADPGNPWVRCDAANVLRELARIDDAETMFKSVLETHPEHVGALTGLGRLARQRRNRVGALGYFEAAAKADPRDPWTLCDLANILRELSRFGEAEAMLISVLETYKEHVGALTGLGHVARPRGARAAPRGPLEAARKSQPQKTGMGGGAATVRRELSRVDDAERMLKTVVETHPQHVAALIGLGHLARQREDRGGTLRWFEAAMAAEPEDLSIRVEFARALRQQGEFARARQLIEKVLDEEPAAAHG